MPYFTEVLEVERSDLFENTVKLKDCGGFNYHSHSSLISIWPLWESYCASHLFSISFLSVWCDGPNLFMVRVEADLWVL